eukprot:356027-Chlamydomonas_euryale.AAC.2
MPPSFATIWMEQSQTLTAPASLRCRHTPCLLTDHFYTHMHPWTSDAVQRKLLEGTERQHDATQGNNIRRDTYGEFFSAILV